MHLPKQAMYNYKVHTNLKCTITHVKCKIKYNFTKSQQRFMTMFKALK